MNIHKNTEKSLIAELTKKDMDYYRLDYNTLSIKNKETKNMLNDLIVGSEIKFNHSAINIDVLYKNENSVFVLITVEKKMHYRLNGYITEAKSLAVLVCGIDSFIGLYKALGTSEYRPKAIVLPDKENYMIFLEECSLDKNNLKRICNEFGLCFECDKLSSSIIKEHLKM